jgi:hypothetical protein
MPFTKWTKGRFLQIKHNECKKKMFVITLEQTFVTVERLEHFCSSSKVPQDVGMPESRTKQSKQTPWPESASELYRPSNCRLLAKLVPAFADKGCHIVSVTDPHCRILGFLDRMPESTVWNIIKHTAELEEGSKVASAIIYRGKKCYNDRNRMSFNNMD